MKTTMIVMACVFSMAMADAVSYTDNAGIADEYVLCLEDHDWDAEVCIQDSIVYIKYSTHTMTENYNKQFWDPLEIVFDIGNDENWFPSELYIIWEDWTCIFTFEQITAAWEILAFPARYDVWIETDDPYSAEVTSSQFPSE